MNEYDYVSSRENQILAHRCFAYGINSKKDEENNGIECRHTLGDLPEYSTLNLVYLYNWICFCSPTSRVILISLLHSFESEKKLASKFCVLISMSKYDMIEDESIGMPSNHLSTLHCKDLALKNSVEKTWLQVLGVTLHHMAGNTWVKTTWAFLWLVDQTLLFHILNRSACLIVVCL